MERLLKPLAGETASEATRQAFRQRIVDHHMDDVEIEIEVSDAPSSPMEIPGMGGQVGMINLGEMMGKAFGQNNLKRRKMKVPDAWAKLVEEESEKRLDQDDVNRVALADAEANGIVFLDEIDKIAVSDVRGGGSVSREGVQRDLLPLDRRHYGCHKIWPDENRPCAVHRLGRVSCFKAERYVARASGTFADPRRTARVGA